jgi:hypothetical protein
VRGTKAQLRKARMAKDENNASCILRWRLTGALIGCMVAIAISAFYAVRDPNSRLFFLAALAVESIGAALVAIKLRSAMKAVDDREPPTT